MTGQKLSLNMLLNRNTKTQWIDLYFKYLSFSLAKNVPRILNMKVYICSHF